MPSFFDLHLHPSFKPFVSAEQAQDKKNCWNPLPNLISAVRSQSSLDQLATGNVDVAVATIVPIERGFSTAFIIQHLFPLLTPLSKEFISKISSGMYTYHQLFNDEIAHLNSLTTQNGKSINFLRKITDKEEGKLNLILAIEGGHALEGKDTEGMEGYKKNLETLKKHPVYRFLYLTLTHLTVSSLCNHAYGMKLIDNAIFQPQSFGISQEGKEIIDLAYDTSKGERILIDIKHMSLVARKQFYKLRKSAAGKAKGYDKIPILATHCGVTGISNTQIQNYFDPQKPPLQKGNSVLVAYQKPQGIGKKNFWNDITYFNPWSINLYNEDIQEIIASDGLIGLSMDQRILGAGKVDVEYFNLKEYQTLFSNQLESFKIKSEFESYDWTKQIYLLQELEEEEEKASAFRETAFSLESTTTESFITLNKRKHRRYLCNTILHIAKAGGAKAWKCMCMGSDFDGLIDPINGYDSAACYPDLENDLVETLEEMIKEAKENEPTINFHITDLKQQVRGIMYDNAKEFLEKNFN